MDGTRGYYAEQNKSIRESQLSYDLTDMRNLRGKAGVMGGREGKMKQDGIRRETNRKRLLISQNKLRGGVIWRGWLGDGHWGGYVLW